MSGQTGVPRAHYFSKEPKESLLIRFSTAARKYWFIYLLAIPGLLFLLYGAWQAIRQRQNARRLILWGAVHDAGLICMALGAANAAAGTGVWLFVAFQLLARGLSWSALNSLAGPAAPSATFAALRGAVKLQPVNGALFALGLMTSVGGSPFLIPEGRLFITQGILASSLPLHCGLFCTVLAAVTATVLIALHVDALRQCFLQPCSTACDGAASGSCRSDALTLVLGVLVAPRPLPARARRAVPRLRFRRRRPSAPNAVPKSRSWRTRAGPTSASPKNSVPPPPL